VLHPVEPLTFRVTVAGTFWGAGHSPRSRSAGL